MNEKVEFMTYSFDKYGKSRIYSAEKLTSHSLTKQTTSFSYFFNFKNISEN